MCTAHPFCLVLVSSFLPSWPVSLRPEEHWLSHIPRTVGKGGRGSQRHVIAHVTDLRLVGEEGRNGGGWGCGDV